MPPRDDQEFEQRRQQIIDGALEVFAEKGYERATNKDIADSAGIRSPGLIYHYFQDKFDLLHQVILERMLLIRFIDSAEILATSDDPPEHVLPDLVAGMFAAVNQRPTITIMKVVMAEALRNHRIAHMVSELGPGRALRLIAKYLERQMDLGRLRRTDPHIAARILIGPFAAYLMTREIFDQPEARAIQESEMARESITIFLRGMAP
ncbi:MAG: TetR/AcrR family transcriptional regulator [Oscillochloris sp.]|nr:TetR/AcrR family transcriptional regulator [Oscillochloris sp.]